MMMTTMIHDILQAFASQYVYCCKKLELDPEKVNVNGGAMALGHPLGATGNNFFLKKMRRQFPVLSPYKGFGP